MDCPQNARLTLRSRELLIRKVVEQGMTLKQAAACVSVRAKTVAKWVRRYREQGAEARSPALRARPTRRSAPSGYQEAGPYRETFPPGHWQPARSCCRHRLGVPARSHRRSLAHRLLGHLPGREAQLSAGLPGCCAGLLCPPRHPLPRCADRQRLGLLRARAFAQACRTLGLKHRFTQPYTPRTNGKAERFIQTALREWAYARSYQNSNERSQELRPWLYQYNWHRPHASLGLSPPVADQISIGITC